jgi:serine phosphatase RsbU (regulator of sigma subunit)
VAIEAAAAAALGETTYGPVGRDLYEALVADLSNGGGTFLATLDEVVGGVLERGGDVGQLQTLITAVQQSTANLLEVGSDPWRAASERLHGARVHLSNASERAPAMTQLRHERLSGYMGRTNRSLMSAESLTSLTAVLAEYLPEYGISSCYVCAYEGDTAPAEWARLILAWDATRELTLPAGGLRFPAGQLAPEGILPSNGLRTYVVYPLDHADAHPGYVIWERGAGLGEVYNGLRLQLGDALGKLGLLDRLVDEARRREAADRERLENEVGVARRIQVAIIPPAVEVPGLEIAARLHRADEPGGEYYDVIPVAGGGWIAAGSVSGRGLPTGLIMLMFQSVVSGLVRGRVAGAPSEVLAVAHAMLQENDRLAHHERARLTLVRYGSDGRMAVAGEYARLSILRAADGRVELVHRPPRAAGDRRDAAGDTLCKLDIGDVLLVCTEGLSRGSAGAGEDRADAASAALGRVGRESAERICDSVMAALRAQQGARGGDVTVIAARHIGAPGGPERTP